MQPTFIHLTIKGAVEEVVFVNIANILYIKKSTSSGTKIWLVDGTNLVVREKYEDIQNMLNENL